MGDYGIKVTNPNASIASTDVRDYMLWSKYFYMKTYIVLTQGYTFSSDLSSVDITITHNYGSPLGVWFSFDGTTQNSQWRGSEFWAYYYSNGGNAASRFWRVVSDANTVTIQYREANVQGSGYVTTGEVWNFKLYIFIEQST